MNQLNNTLAQQSITPIPQYARHTNKGFLLPSTVYVAAEEQVDPYAMKLLNVVLLDTGVSRIEHLREGESAPEKAITIWIGNHNWQAAKDALNNVVENDQMDQIDELPAEGYLLAAGEGKDGRASIVLMGADNAGTYYAVKTLSQIIRNGKDGNEVLGIYVNDFPDLPIRGIVEGYYGEPLSHEDRLSLFEFSSDHKMNAYVYAPKDDLRHRLLWREPYSSEEMKQFEGLVQAAKENHIRFVFSLSPGNDICYSCDNDFKLLVDKMQAMFDLGVREFGLLLDDIVPSLHHEQDAKMFNSKPDPVAAAQAYLLNRFNKDFIKTHPDIKPLITCSIEYYQEETSVYREQFAALVDKDILVYWTGINSAATITTDDADKISAIFQHELLTWNNYPNNDYVIEKLHLAPLLGRDPDMQKHNIAGMTVNVMEQGEANKIALYTVADYSWNSKAYDPWRSWKESLHAFAGPHADILETFAENNLSSPLYAQESATLTPLIDSFWSAYSKGDAQQEAEALLAELKKLENLPEALQVLENKRFLQEVHEWIEKTKFYGIVGQTAVHMLMAMQSDDMKQAAEYRKLLDEQLKQDTIDVIEPKDRKASRRLDGINIPRGEHELIRYTPAFGERTETNPWGYEITVIDGLIVKTGGNDNVIPKNGYVLSLHYNYALDTPDYKWLQDNTIEGASVTILDGVVDIDIKKGVYPVTNKKQVAKGVMDVFVQQAIEAYEN